MIPVTDEQPWLRGQMTGSRSHSSEAARPFASPFAQGGLVKKFVPSDVTNSFQENRSPHAQP